MAALLTAAYWVVDDIATLLEPLAGGASAAIAIVVLTLLVRTALIPVGIRK
jgi:YidC/Oxa1 family membrane protein insertase